MKKIQLAFLMLSFSIFLPQQIKASCLVQDTMADSLMDRQSTQMYQQFTREICGGGYTTPSCTSGQYLSGSTCKYCSSAMSGCSACSSVSVCTTCFSGYYKSNNKCYECPTGCATCSSASSCSSCESGYTLSSGKCIKPCDAGCSSCDTSTGKCNMCKAGYFKNSLGKCVACPSGCSSCSSSSNCSKCVSGHTLIGGLCYAGQTRCPNGQTLTDGTCCNF